MCFKCQIISKNKIIQLNISLLFVFNPSLTSLQLSAPQVHFTPSKKSVTATVAVLPHLLKS